MSQSILQQIWDKTLNKLNENELFEHNRLSEISNAVEVNDTAEIQTVLCKKYEDQETSN